MGISLTSIHIFGTTAPEGAELFFFECDLNCCMLHRLLHSTKSRHTVFAMCLLCVFVLYCPMLCAGELVEDQ